MSLDRRKPLLVFGLPIWPGLAGSQNGVGSPDDGFDFISIIQEDVLINARHLDRCLSPHKAVRKQNLTNLMVRAYSPRVVAADIGNQWDNVLISIADIGQLALVVKWQAMRVTWRCGSSKTVVFFPRHRFYLFRSF